MMIYLDNASTTFIDPDVKKAMTDFLAEQAGNASSIHRFGVRAAKAVEKARLIIAEKINAAPAEIVFTSGGTESNNLTLKGVALGRRGKGSHIIISGVEHASVIEPALWLERRGFSVTRVPVDREGFVDPAAVAKNIRRGTILVSIMHANNEIGTIEPVEEIGRLCRARDVLFHTDACQSFAKEPIDVRRSRLDLVSLSAHKIHGPRGVGALYIGKGVRIEPLLHGGGQENGLRSGTYNSEGIVGFGKAAEIADEKDVERMKGLRDRCIDAVLRGAGTARLSGPRAERLCSNAHFRFAGKNGKTLARILNERNIFVSPGSACHAHADAPSHVLRALGLSEREALSGIRLSLSKWTTRPEIDRAVKALISLARGGTLD